MGRIEVVGDSTSQKPQLLDVVEVVVDVVEEEEEEVVVEEVVARSLETGMKEMISALTSDPAAWPGKA